MLTKGHLKSEEGSQLIGGGIWEMVGIRFAMNKGLTDERSPFQTLLPNLPPPAGGGGYEGCFIIYILSGKYCGLKLTITQHSKDE